MTDSILGILYWMLQLLTFALIARALLSWVDPRMEWGVSRIIVEVTDPVVAPLRRVIPPLGMIDICVPGGDPADPVADAVDPAGDVKRMPGERMALPSVACFRQ